jgi:hypothetical protein
MLKFSTAKSLLNYIRKIAGIPPRSICSLKEPAVPFEERYGEASLHEKDQKQWNGGRHLTADELKKMKKINEQI